MENKPIIIGIVVIILVAAGFGFWYWSKNKQAPKEIPSLGSQIFDKTQNTLKGQMPDVNPFKDQKNPLDAIYQNPFK